MAEIDHLNFAVKIYTFRGENGHCFLTNIEEPLFPVLRIQSTTKSGRGGHLRAVATSWALKTTKLSLNRLRLPCQCEITIILQKADILQKGPIILSMIVLKHL